LTLVTISQINVPAIPRGFTPDSSKILFTSASNLLVPDDTNPPRSAGVSGEDVFAYDIATGVYERISVNEAGEQAEGQTFANFVVADGSGVFVGSNAPNLGTIETDGVNDWSFLITLSAPGGGDTIDAGLGDDIVFGGLGNDTIDGGGGTDYLFGGPGDDTFYVDGQWDLVFENPDEGTDTIRSPVSFYLYGNVEALILELGMGDLFGVGNELDNTLAGNEGVNLLIGWDGADTLYGGAGNDVLYGVNGNDMLFGEAGIDVLIAGGGDDYLDGGDNPDEMYGEDDNDTLYGGTGFFTDILVGGDGNDMLDGSADPLSGETRNEGDYDLMYGGLGDDIYYVDTPADLTFEFNDLAEGNDTVYADIVEAGYYLYGSVENLILLGNTPFGVGNELDNELTGNAAANWLRGDAGNDRLNGKKGNDVLFGESGADTFVFEPETGADLVGDFDKAEDKIELKGTAFNSFADLTNANAIFENGGSSVIDLGAGDLIVISGVTGLSSANILFS
jgi:Ca2+-binding RTX toxin-like protein